MKRQHFIFMWVLGIGLFLTAIPLNASLLITPLQVIMEGRERSAEVILINPSQDTNTYRLHWLQLKQVEGAGGYVPSTDEEIAQNLDLQDFTVFTPRQVTLKPNEKQTVKIAVRRPADLPDGEYKSHLRFMIVPELSSKQGEDKPVGPNETGFGAKVYASYSIPVIYRAGEVSVSAEIGTPTFSINEKTSSLVVDVPITRSGTHGIIGQINVYYTPNGEKEYLIAAQGNANLFPEINTRVFSILTKEKNLRPGQMRIVFATGEFTKDKNRVIDEKTFPVGR